ncbi:MAG: hypothetical protein A2X36_01845 [Elusimicrobia bacterium GWA2_69_24]|nr:MAG: hypothetical protein A2X36_01845 [Elusimicrobia bacterium GWA2_69_24]HBL16886.1 hypothetical protein [Elusimicrobiota bacterium]
MTIRWFRCCSALLMASAMAWTSARLCLMPASVCGQKSSASCHHHGAPAQPCCGGVHLVASIGAPADILKAGRPIVSVLLPVAVPELRPAPFMTRVAPGPSPGSTGSLPSPQFLSRAPPLS